MTTAKPSIFISYSHKDAPLMKRLVTHLGTYQRAGLLDVWDDRRIQAGQEWAAEIERAIQQAKVAVFLISGDFLDSDFICGQEIPPILERRAQDGLTVVPVILKACNWRDVSWLQGTQARPPGKPLFGRKGNDREEALAAIAKEIKELLQAEAPPRPSSPHTRPTEIPLAIHQLPTPPADFTGRVADLEALKEAVGEGKTTAIFGMHGLGGVGKTALALKLANEIRSFYPDGQIFLDLLGVTTPLSVSEAMSHVIRSFHPGSQLPATEAELAALYRSVLHGKRVLLLMDNAAGKDQVEPLIPPEGSALLVTSRIRFALPGLVEKDLDELPREESCEFLLKICPRIEKHAEAIAKVCGDLPLALRVVASTLRERATLSPRSYLQRLSTGKERLKPVETALALSYELLSEELRLRWRQLAVFPDTFDLKAAAAIWLVDAEAAEPVLSEFERNSLLEWEETSDRYRLHDLVRVFADQRLDRTERDTAREAHAKYYLEVLHLANASNSTDEERLIQGLNELDLEWHNIQAGQAFAATSLNQNDIILRLCNGYPIAGGTCLALRQTPTERISWLEAALVAAQRLNERVAELSHLTSLGNAYLHMGEPRRAIELYEQGIAIARENGSRESEADLLGGIGNAHGDLGEHHKAMEFYEQNLSITRSIGDRQGEKSALSRLGVAYINVGEPRKAVDLFEQQIDIARELGDQHGKGGILNNLGSAYAALGEYRRAIELYEQRLAIARILRDRRGQEKSAYNLGTAYRALGEPRRAIEFFELQLAMSRELRNRASECEALNTLGLVYNDLREYRQAIDFFEQQLAIGREIGNREWEGSALGNLAAAYAELGEPARAVKLLEERLAIACEIGDRQRQGSTLGNLGIVYAKLGELHRSVEFHEQQLAITREIGDRPGEGQALAGLANAYEAQNSTQAIELYEESLVITREIGDRREEAIASWNLGLMYEQDNPARAVELMQICVDFEREAGDPDAEADAAYVEAIRVRIKP